MPQYGCRSCCPRSLSPLLWVSAGGSHGGKGAFGRGGRVGANQSVSGTCKSNHCPQTAVRIEVSEAPRAARGQHMGSTATRISTAKQPTPKRSLLLPRHLHPQGRSPWDGQAHAGSTKGPCKPRGWLHLLMDVQKRAAGSVGQPCHPRIGLPGIAAVTHGEGNAAYAFPLAFPWRSHERRCTSPRQGLELSPLPPPSTQGHITAPAPSHPQNCGCKKQPGPCALHISKPRDPLLRNKDTTASPSTPAPCASTLLPRLFTQPKWKPPVSEVLRKVGGPPKASSCRRAPSTSRGGERSPAGAGSTGPAPAVLRRYRGWRRSVALPSSAPAAEPIAAVLSSLTTRREKKICGEIGKIQRRGAVRCSDS